MKNNRYGRTQRGYFGQFGGRFVSETLIHALDELREAYGRWRKDEEFVQEDG